MMCRARTGPGLCALPAFALMLVCQPLEASPAIDAMIETLEERGIAVAYRDITTMGSDHRLTDVTLTLQPTFQLRAGLYPDMFANLLDDDPIIRSSLDAITLTELDPATFRVTLPPTGSIRTDANLFLEPMMLDSRFALEGQDIILAVVDEEIDVSWAIDRLSMATVQISDMTQTSSHVELFDTAGEFTITGPVGKTETVSYAARVGSARRFFDSPVEAGSATDSLPPTAQMAFFESAHEIRVVVSPQKSALADLLDGVPVISGSFVAEPSVIMVLPDQAVPDAAETVLMQDNSFDFLLDETRVLVSADLAGLEYLQVQSGSEFPILQSNRHAFLLSLAFGDPDSITGTLQFRTDDLEVNKDILHPLDPSRLLTDTTISHDIEIGFEAGIAAQDDIDDAMPFNHILARIRTFSLNLLGTTLTVDGGLELVKTGPSEQDLIGRIDLETRNFRTLIALLSQMPATPPFLLFLAMQSLSDYLPGWDAGDDQPKRYTYVFEPGDRMTVNGVTP